MLGLKLFKRTKKYVHPLKKEQRKQGRHTNPNSVAAWAAKKKTVQKSQMDVLKALVKEKRPAHYRMLSQSMGIMEGSITPRLAELRRKGLIKIAYINYGFNRVRVNYYLPTSRGIRALMEREAE